MITEQLQCDADALRFLPGHVTISSIAGTFWSSDRESVATGFHTVPHPESPAVHPLFHHHHTIGVDSDAADLDSTATLLLEVPVSSFKPLLSLIILTFTECIS